MTYNPMYDDMGGYEEAPRVKELSPEGYHRKVVTLLKQTLVPLRSNVVEITDRDVFRHICAEQQYQFLLLEKEYFEGLGYWKCVPCSTIWYEDRVI